MNNTLRVYGIKEESLVDGPGIRFALFVQGCYLNCPGCHNPAAKDPAGGKEMELEEILKRIERAGNLDGITFSGGEPFLQSGPLSVLGKEIRLRNQHLMVFSGYTWEELQKWSSESREVKELLDVTQILVDGPYIREQRELSLPYRGSSNQRIIDVSSSLEKGFAVPMLEGV